MVVPANALCLAEVLKQVVVSPVFFGVFSLARSDVNSITRSHTSTLNSIRSRLLFDFAWHVRFGLRKRA